MNLVLGFENSCPNHENEEQVLAEAWLFLNVGNGDGHRKQEAGTNFLNAAYNGQPWLQEVAVNI